MTDQGGRARAQEHLRDITIDDQLARGATHRVIEQRRPLDDALTDQLLQRLREHVASDGGSL